MEIITFLTFPPSFCIGHFLFQMETRWTDPHSSLGKQPGIEHRLTSITCSLRHFIQLRLTFHRRQICSILSLTIDENLHQLKKIQWTFTYTVYAYIYLMTANLQLSSQDLGNVTPFNNLHGKNHLPFWAYK